MVMTKRVQVVCLAASSAVLLMLLGARRLPKYRPTTLNGIRNICHAVIHCRQTGLEGWDLVAYAQQLVSQKFAAYTTLNL